MKVPSLVDMLKSGVHFGHRTSKWHPNMEPYIFGSKKNIHIINLEESQAKLEEAAKVAKDLAANGKQILIIGTKQQAAALVQKHATDCEMPFVSSRWLGGLLTNFKNVSQVARKLTKLKKDRESGELKKYTKKEQLEFDREIDRLQISVGGLETLMKLPDALIIVDLKEEKTALREAEQMKIPVIAMCDTNVDPGKAAYPIPANDDAVKSIDLVLGTLSAAISEGLKNPVVQEAPAGSKDSKDAKDAVKKATRKKAATK